MRRATLLIATRNRAPQLRRALASIREQWYSGIDILVVDDDSHDATGEVLKDFGGLMRVHRIKRIGETGYRRNPSDVLNIGHALAYHDIVIEQGGEVCHVTDCVTPLLRVCRQGVVALARVHNGDEIQYERLCKRVKTGSYDYPEDVVAVPPIMTSGDRFPPVMCGDGTEIYVGVERPCPFFFCGAIHRRDFANAGGYDPSTPGANDQHLADRLAGNGVEFVFVGTAVAFHLRHGKT